MNSLEQMMGLTPQGYPSDMPTQGIDPTLLMAMQGQDAELMEGLGVPPLEDPYAMVGMEAGNMLAQQMLGGQPPQMTQAELKQLAATLGLTDETGGIDPMYSQTFDWTKYMTGGY